MRTTSRWVMPILSLVLFFGAIGVAQAAGWWVTSGREVVPAGQMTVDDLKGWMTLQESADGLGVPADDLVALVGAQEGLAVSADTALKDLEALVPGFELTTYREWVQAYLDERAGGAAAVTPTAIPTAATTAPSGTSSAPTTPMSTTPVSIATPTGPPSGTAESGVRGSMTIREVAETNGVAVDRLLVESGLPADLDPDTVLREIQNEVPGFELQTIRDAIARLAG